MSRITAQHTIHMIDTHIEEPAIGAQVLCTTIGNKLVETVWKADSKLYFDAYSHYPSIPRSVKLRQLARLQREKM